MIDQFTTEVYMRSYKIRCRLIRIWTATTFKNKPSGKLKKVYITICVLIL